MMAFDISFPLTRGVVTELLELISVPSTNSYAKANDHVLPDFSLVMTTDQTKGRGRLGRNWIARPGEMLALSYVVAPKLVSHISWLPLVAGASLAHALRAVGIEGVSLKWPNDVLVQGLKLAGVLCEATRGNRVIVGLGMNLTFPRETPPSPLATALAHHHESSKSVLDEVVAGWVTGIRNWLDGDESSAVETSRKLVTPVMGTLGRNVIVEEPSGDTWEGVAENLDPSGHLMVRETNSHILRRVVASDITHLRQ